MVPDDDIDVPGDRPVPPAAPLPPSPPAPPAPPSAPAPPAPPAPASPEAAWGDDAPPAEPRGVGFDDGADGAEWTREVAQAAAGAARAAGRGATAAADAAGGAAERFAARFEGLSDEIQRRIDEALRSLPDRLTAAGLEPDEIERIRAGLSQAGERAAERIEHKVAHVVARARQAAERAADRAARQAQRAGEGRRWGARMAFGHGPHGAPGRDGPFGHRGPRAAGSDSETMAVLRMLGEGKISAEEAERLLAALGRVEQRV